MKEEIYGSERVEKRNFRVRKMDLVEFEDFKLLGRLFLNLGPLTLIFLTTNGSGYVSDTQNPHWANTSTAEDHF